MRYSRTVRSRSGSSGGSPGRAEAAARGGGPSWRHSVTAFWRWSVRSAVTTWELCASTRKSNWHSAAMESSRDSRAGSGAGR